MFWSTNVSKAKSLVQSVKSGASGDFLSFGSLSGPVLSSHTFLLVWTATANAGALFGLFEGCMVSFPHRGAAKCKQRKEDSGHNPPSSSLHSKTF